MAGYCITRPISTDTTVTLCLPSICLNSVVLLYSVDFATQIGAIFSHIVVAFP